MAYESIGVVGDEFVQNTFVSNISSRTTYMGDHFDILEFTSNRYEDGNVLNRIHNNVVRAMEKHVLFPKSIPVILDSDLIKSLDDQDIARVVGIGIDYLVKTLHHTIATYRDLLPAKSRRFKYPTVLWITPPCHVNFTDNVKRQHLSGAIENAALQYNEMRFLKLRNWSYHDTSFFSALYHWISVYEHWIGEILVCN